MMGLGFPCSVLKTARLSLKQFVSASADVNREQGDNEAETHLEQKLTATIMRR